MAKYNGHRNYNAWNVALWLHNDEGLYTLMCGELAAGKSQGLRRPEIADNILRILLDSGLKATPDNVPYTRTNILLALRGH